MADGDTPDGGYGDVPVPPGGPGFPPPYGQHPSTGWHSAPYQQEQPAYGPAGYGPPVYGPPAYGPPPWQQQVFGPPPWVATFPKPTGWLIAAWVLFWPLGLYSTLSAWENIDRALFRGDLAEAGRQAGRVRTIGIIAICVPAAFLVFWLIFVGLVLGAFATGG